MAALDRKRSFGTISGDTEGRMFEQDNLFFTANGSQWHPQQDDEPLPVVKAAAKKAKPAEAAPVVVAPVDAQLDAQMGAA